VLDFARPIRFEIDTVDVNVLCRDAVEATAAGEAGPSIDTELDESIPPIRTDGERLRIALVNVLSNARHAVLAADAEAAAAATDRGARQVSTRDGGLPIELITRLDDGRLSIVVRDRGIGIDPDDLVRVFEPYFTRKRTGSGLGLAIAKNIVEGLGGTISAASRPQAGTEIRIELPIRHEEDRSEHEGARDGALVGGSV
jgi:signal transduction histidine kinase